MGMFGFTNDTKEFDLVCAFRDAAIADGWDHKGTYEPTEAEDRACQLSRDGFIMHILTRSRENWIPDSRYSNQLSPHGKWNYESEVNIWGPDGLAIHAGPVYDWNEITSKVRACPKCGSKNVDTVRVGFAGRYCQFCADKVRPSIETHGWCD